MDEESVQSRYIRRELLIQSWDTSSVRNIKHHLAIAKFVLVLLLFKSGSHIPRDTLQPHIARHGHNAEDLG